MLLPLLQNNLLAGGGSGVNVTPGVVALTLTGYAPTVTAPAAVTPGAATLTLTGFAPTVGVSVNVTPDVGTLTLTGFAPSVSAPAAVTPGAASLVLTGFAPTVTAPASVTPSAGALTLTGFAPAVTVAGGSVSVTPDPAALTLTGYPPDISGVSTFQIIHGPGNKPWKREKGSYWDALLSPPLQARLEELEPQVAEVIEAKAAEQIDKPITERTARLQMRKAMDSLGFQYEKSYEEIYLQVVAEMRQAQEDEAIANIIAALI